MSDVLPRTGSVNRAAKETHSYTDEKRQKNGGWTPRSSAPVGKNVPVSPGSVRREAATDAARGRRSAIMTTPKQHKPTFRLEQSRETLPSRGDLDSRSRSRFYIDRPKVVSLRSSVGVGGGDDNDE